MDIKLDTCLNKKGEYEICVYQDISNLDMAERVETLRKFKTKGLKMFETTCDTLFLDILREFNIKVDNSTEKGLLNALKVFKSKSGKTIKAIPQKNKDINSSVVGITELGHDICLSKDNRLYMVEKVGLCEVEKGLN